jgi:hypothetical protein
MISIKANDSLYLLQFKGILSKVIPPVIDVTLLAAAGVLRLFAAFSVATGGYGVLHSISEFCPTMISRMLLAKA